MWVWGEGGEVAWLYIEDWINKLAGYSTEQVTHHTISSFFFLNGQIKASALAVELLGNISLISRQDDFRIHLLSFESALLQGCESQFRLDPAGLKDLGCTCLRLEDCADLWCSGGLKVAFLLFLPSFPLPHRLSFLPLYLPSALQPQNCWGPLCLLPSSSSCCWITWQPPALPRIPGPRSWCSLRCWVAAPNTSSDRTSSRLPTRWPSPTSARNINRSAGGSSGLVVVDLFWTYLPENESCLPLSAPFTPSTTTSIYCWQLSSSTSRSSPWKRESFCLKY